VINRRAFLELSSAGLAAKLKALAEAPMPMITLGRSGLRVSRFVLGGYHMAVQGEETGVRIIHRAIDLGVNFLDNAHLYHKGRSEEIYGKALGGGLRQKVLVMSKAHLRERDSAMRQLEETLTRMKTDYLDLWQCHQVSAQKEVDQILGPNGSLEAFVRAKQQGKARHIGFTGHAHPNLLQQLLDAYDGWESVQFPVNLVDPHYNSFILNFLPKARKKGLGVIAMKSNAIGGITKHGIAEISECLRFTLSQTVDVVVSGVESVEQLEHNLAVVKGFKPMSKKEIAAVLARTRKGKTGKEVEVYKSWTEPKGDETTALPCHQDGEPV
jgi:aryl-alcohol dehydrogenase-like predicted oxidoreductase